MATLSEEDLQYLVDRVQFLVKQIEFDRKSLEHIANLLKMHMEGGWNED
jgi:hypothetical protein